MTDTVNILVLDPDDQCVDEYLASLPGPDWRLDHARTVKEALRLAGKSAYDIALIDMMLPDGLGSDAWHQLKSLRPQMVGIMTTSSAVLHNSITPADRRLLAYLLKPFHPSLLWDCVSEALAHPVAQTEGWRPQRALPEPHPSYSGAAHKPLAARSFSLPIILAEILFAIILVLGGSNVAWASQAALPGDTLYPVKTSIESAKLVLTLDSSSQVELLLDLAQTREEEINTLVAKGRYEDIAIAAGRYDDEVQRVTSILHVIAKQDTVSGQALALHVQKSLSHSTRLLETMLEQVPAEAKPALEKALAVSAASQSDAEQVLSQPTITPTPPGPNTTPGPKNTPGANGTPGAKNTPEPKNTPEANGTPGPKNTPEPKKTPEPTNTSEPKNTPGANGTPGPKTTPESKNTPGPKNTPEPKNTPVGPKNTPKPKNTPGSKNAPGEVKTPTQP